MLITLDKCHSTHKVILSPHLHCVCACVCVWPCALISNLAPGFVILNTVNRQSDHLHSSFLELIGELCGTGELGGADGGEVPWV